MMKKILLAQAIVTSLAIAPAAHADEAALMKRIDQLAAELEKVKAELSATRQKADAVEQRQQAATSVTASTPATAATTSAASAPSAQPMPTPVAAAPTAVLTSPALPVGSTYPGIEAPERPRTVFSAYGEINYNRPTRNAGGAQVDVRRTVLGFEHRFDERTKVVTELEWEHAIASAGDRGEAAVEQVYVEREFGTGLRAKAGLFLVPAGLLNQNHEPTAYYGVERNFVETAIIPTTWREAGLGVGKTLDNGLTLEGGLTTGFDLNKWDASSSEGRESPLGSIHQEGQFAKARNLAGYGAANWRGVPGLLIGGSVFTGTAGHATPDFAANNARVTLWDLHARYNPGRWDLSALYARGTISNTEALNLTFVGNPSPVPSSFYGWYGQAAYRLWKQGDYALFPFVRYERFNTAKTFAAIPAGLGVANAPDERVVTVGANLRVGSGVVLKADYQKFAEDKSRDRVNLGVGFSF
ncbi:porin family protein [Noviherbaspirillum soli]|uniref:hypothetical protein n=1 Tax=Noviherbaspirillum soli TaxID=1064518 RepID=UPI001E3EB3B2|nr:hypothetical protein [Noviherbaspirillum soli]